MGRLFLTGVSKADEGNGPLMLLFSEWADSVFSRRAQKDPSIPDWRRGRTATPGQDNGEPFLRLTLCSISSDGKGQLKEGWTGEVSSRADCVKGAMQGSTATAPVEEQETYLSLVYQAITGVLVSPASSSPDSAAVSSAVCWEWVPEGDGGRVAVKTTVQGLVMNLGQYSLKKVTGDAWNEAQAMVMRQWFQRDRQLQERLDGMGRRVQDMMVQKNQAMQQVDEMVSVKQQMEEELFKKFTLVLNAKKERIRELEEQVSRLSGSKNTFKEVASEEEITNNAATSNKQKKKVTKASSSKKGRAPAKKRARKAVTESDEETEEEESVST